MMFHIILSAILLVNSFLGYASTKVRHVPMKKDQIVTVRTSLGIATIIEVPDRPSSVVVGDQDSFKVEYLDQAITIKPLSSGAKSNLYVYTDWARYNVELVTGPEEVADYVVYLDHQKREEKKPKQEKDVIWTKLRNFLRNDKIRVDVDRVGRGLSGVLLVEFVVSSSSNDNFKPEWLWITQDGVTVPIHNLFLSNLELKANRPSKGAIQLLSSDLNLDQPFRMELRRQKNSYLTIKKVKSWK